MASTVRTARLAATDNLAVRRARRCLLAVLTLAATLTASPPPASAGHGALLLVTADGGTSGRNGDLRLQFEGYGWTVTAIDDDSASLLAWAEASDVVYVARGTNVAAATTLRAAKIAAATEEASHFGTWFFDGSNAVSINGPANALNVVDASHPITSPLGLGTTTLFSTSGNLTAWNQPPPGDIDVLLTSPVDPGRRVLMEVDSGEDQGGGNIAQHRRVFFTGADFAVADWNADMDAMMERALDWAAAGVALCPLDSDGDGLWDCHEDWNRDADDDPVTDPGPDTDGDTIPNHLDADDDGDGTLTIAENADPTGDGDPRDARDLDRDGQPDYLDVEAGASTTPIAAEQKISAIGGGLVGPLDDDDNLGQDVTGIGDLDGDGINDLAVGVPEDDDGGTSRGAVYVLFMNVDGTVRAEQKISDTAGGFAGALTDFGEFGHGVATLGDVDGDGVTDIAVGTWTDVDGGPGRGAVWILFLERNGTVKAHQKISDTNGGLVAVLDDYDRFGSSLTGLGDLDDDGTPDLAAGARWDDDGGTDRGAAYILFLNPDGTVRAEQKISDTAGGLVGVLDDFDEFGHDVAGIGDLDGDGIGDLAVGAPLDDDGGTDRGAAYVLFLNVDGTVRAEQKLSATAGPLAPALDDGDWFGTALAGTGHLDGNGTPDLAVGARGDSDGAPNAGAVYLLRLAADGTIVGADKISATTGGLAGPLDAFDHFGRGIGSLGDLDSDGSLNLAVSARYDDEGGNNRGAIYILDLTAASPTVTVNSTGDAGDLAPGDDLCRTGGLNAEGDPECTLRAAIEEANANASITTIEFTIPTSDTGHSAGVWTITPTSPYDPISGTVTIDGATQPGWTTTPVVELNGALAGAGADGLSVSSDGTTIRGLAINRFLGDGIKVDSTSSNTVVVGNHIGLDAAGLIDRGNGGRGIDLQTGSGPTTVGGSTSVDRNVISGNGGDGIILWNASGNTIIGNYIGTDATGNASGVGIGNGADGIAMGGGAANNVIGQPGAGNVLSGNANDGLEMDGPTSGHQVQANTIGLGADGSTVIANGRRGVVLYNGAATITIGGDAGAGEGNLISGNTQEGIHINANLDLTTTSLTVQGNRIGTDATGLLDRGNGTTGLHLFNGVSATTIGGPGGLSNVISGNGADGVLIQGAQTLDTVIQGNLVGVGSDGGTPMGNGQRGIAVFDADDVTIGGIAAGTGNVIARSASRGVMTNSGATDITLLGNSIVGNFDIGIDLGLDGVTLNDAGDIDLGSNGLLNFPEISSATETAGIVTVSFDLDLPAGTYRIEAFTNPSGADPTGYGQGEIFRGATTIAHTGSGTEAFSLDYTGAAADVVTLTTTEQAAGPAYGATSEFSAAYTVATQPPVADAGGPYTIAEGDSLDLDASASTDPDLDTLSFTWDLDGDGLFDDATGETPTVPWSTLVTLGIDDDGAYPVAVRADDGNGSSDTAAGTLTVTNRAPAVTVTGPGSTAPGGVYTVDLEVTDPGDDTVTSWHIDWGDGTFETIAGNPSTATHVYQHGRPHAITAAVVDEDGVRQAGDLFVIDFIADRVIQLDGTTGDNVRFFPTNPLLDGPGDVILGPDGLLYVSGYLSHTVLRYDPQTGAFVDVFVPAGTGGLSGPTGLEFAPDGALLVAGYNTNSIKRFDGVTGAYLGDLVAPGAGGIDGPLSIVYGPDGNLYVSNWFSSRIVRFDPDDGSLIDVFTSVDTNLAVDLAFGPDGDLYVSHNGPTARVQRFDGDTGTFVGDVLNKDFVFGIAFEPDGTMLLGSEYNDTIDRHTLAGGYIENLSGPADGLTQPWFIEIEPAHWVTVGPIVVNTTVDTADDDITDGRCDTGGPLVAGDPQCSLRAALETVNAVGGNPAIEFDIPTGDLGHAGGVWTITPGSPLPNIAAIVSIDGTTQPGWTSTPVIEIDGSAAGPGTSGLTLSSGSSGSTIEGVVIGRFSLHGLVIDYGSIDNTIVGNHLGTDASGTIDRGNGISGIYVLAGGNTIGGGAAGERNVISGNDGYGIFVGDGAKNTISGNYIGVDVSGNVGLGNTFNGIYLGGADQLIGGTGSGEGNVIGDHGDIAIRIEGTTGHRILGNSIGVGADGTTALGNLVAVSARFGAGDVQIGGDTPGAGNTIVGNGYGVIVEDASTSGIAVIGNTIVGNSQLAIDLGGDSVTANDAGDGDSGANDLLNFPVITANGETGGTVDVDYELDVPAGTYRIEFFLNPSGADPTGHGEGEQFVHAAIATHTGSGSETFTTSFAGDFGDVITATTTEDLGAGAHGATSEFSAAYTLAPPTIVDDLSIRGNDLVVAGGIVPTVPVGSVGANGFGFGGGLERLVGPATEIRGPALTMAAWIQLETFGSQPRIVSKGSGAGAIYEMLIDDTTGEAVARIEIGGLVHEARGGSIVLGTLHHVAATWDGATVSLYVDGASVDAVAAAGALGSDLTEPLIIGNNRTGLSGLDGTIDQVELHHRAVSAPEILARYRNGADPATVSVGGVQTGAPAPWTTSVSQARSGSSSLAAPTTTPGANAWVTAIGLDEPGVELTAWWWLSDEVANQVSVGTRTGVVPTDQFDVSATGTGLSLGLLDGASNTTAATDPTTLTPGTWQRVVMSTDELGVTSFVLDGVTTLGPSGLSGLSSGSVGFRAVDIAIGHRWFVDDVQLRRLVSDEPTTSLGPIERS